MYKKKDAILISPKPSVETRTKKELYSQAEEYNTLIILLLNCQIIGPTKV